MTVKRTCAECAHCEPDPPDPTGECRRFPPTATGWPTVNPDDWCSEFQLGEPGLAVGGAPIPQRKPHGRTAEERVEIEARIIELAAAGLSNRAIADKIGVVSREYVNRYFARNR